MTKSEFFSTIRSGIRRIFRYWKPMMIALKAAERPSQSSNKRLKYEYLCAECNNWFKRADVHIDHIIPCGSLKEWEDIVPFIKRVTEEDPSQYQVLCKPCHQIKTNFERELNKIKNSE